MVTMDLNINTIPLSSRGVENFYWPIKAHEINQNFELMTKKVVSVLKTAEKEALPGTDEGIILGLFFIQEAIASYQAKLLIGCAKRDGHSIQTSKRNRLIHAYLTGNMPYSPAILRTLQSGPAPLKLWRAPLRLLRDIYMSQQEGIARRTFFPVKYTTRTVTLTISELPILVAKEMHESILYKRANFWFTTPDLRKISYKNQYDDIVDQLLFSINAVFISGGESFNDVKLYLDQWLRNAMPLVAFHLATLEKCKNKIPKTVWLSTAGNLWGRILARYMRKNGGELIRFSHGSGSGYFKNSRAQGVFNFEDCDTFFSYTEKHAQECKKNFTGNEIVQNKCPEILTYHRKKPTFTQKTMHDKKTIMYVSSVYPGEHVYLCAKGMMSDITLLDWEVRLIKQLQAWHFNVILKPHPSETICLGVPDSVKTVVGNIIANEPFEAIFHKADVIILDTPVTSLFSTLVTSGRPFVFLDFDVEEFSQTAYHMLQKRCPIVKGFYDENNRAYLDWQALYEAIQTCDQYHNDEFMKNYFYQSGISHQCETIKTVNVGNE